MLAEVAQRGVDERGRVGREEHLTAVARVGDPARAVDVEADEMAVVLPRDPGVEAHAHANLPAGRPVVLGEGALRG